MTMRAALATATAIIALAANAAAQTPGAFFKGKSGCQMWWSHDMPPDSHSTVSAEWRGSCRNGMAQGHGTFEVVERDQLEGAAQPYFIRFTGEGDAVGGKLQGRAFFVSTDMPYSSVHHLQGPDAGKVTYLRGNGSFRVEGEFANGVLNGRGFKLTQDGDLKSRTEGEFRNGKLNGWGVQESEYRQEETGKLVWFDRHEGEFRDGKLEGKGIWIAGFRGCAAQARFEGEFRDGALDGRGTLKAYDGKVYSGVWQDGRFKGQSFFMLWALESGMSRCR